MLELAKPVHHHRTGEFRAMFAEVQALLQYVYQTKQTVYTITGSGTAAAEAGIVNALAARPEGPVRHQRQVRRALGQGLRAPTASSTRTSSSTTASPPRPQQIAAELKAAKYDAVILVHSETSTATVCDLEGIGKAVRAAAATRC